MSKTLSMATMVYVRGLNALFGKDYRFDAMPGQKFDRVTQQHDIGVMAGKSVHAFVERETGHVYKAAGWNAPAKGVRYQAVSEALKHADPYGSYLYK